MPNDDTFCFAFVRGAVTKITGRGEKRSTPLSSDFPVISPEELRTVWRYVRWRGHFAGQIEGLFFVHRVAVRWRKPAVGYGRPLR